jgi:hypothetical protein
MKKTSAVLSRIGWVMLGAVTWSACVSFATPPPFVTLGGPPSAGRRGHQLGLAAGSAVSLFSGAHAGGIGYLGRYRFGLTDRLDLGADVLGYQRGNKGGLSGMIDGKARVARWVAVELGLGAADDSDGKSLGFQTGLILGSDRRAVWDLYGALRFGGALGLTHNPIDSNDPTTLGAQDALFGLGTLGASARVLPCARFLFEVGYGLLFVRRNPDVGQGLYLAVGMLFDVPGPRAELSPGERSPR